VTAEGGADREAVEEKVEEVEDDGRDVMGSEGRGVDVAVNGISSC
jgi:hypothetical protein